MRHVTTLIFLSALTFGCGPLSSKQQEKASPTPAHADPNVLDANQTYNEPVNDKHVPSAPANDDEPVSSPAQTPFQGELPSLTIDDVALTGDGCAPDTTAVNISDDAKAFTVLFADFVVELNAGAERGKDGVARASRRCRAALTLNVPHGYRVAVLTIDYRGFADLQDGADAALRSGVSFGNQLPKFFDHDLSGPLSEEFSLRDTLTLMTTSYSSCGGKAVLNVDVRASIAAQDGVTGLLALDSADGELTQTYGLAWRRCPT